jgi:cell division septation protein DedD
LAETVPEEPVVEAAPELSAAPGGEPAIAAPEPEVAAPEPTIAAPEAEAPAVAVMPSTTEAKSLIRKSFYLQLGAYSTLGLAEKLASQVSAYARYTVEILPATSGAAPLYKVLIGPLNRDESGTLLYQFRARGFRDAFVQYVE